MSDVLCRYGGEEFCVLLPETDESGAAAWADRACTAIEVGEKTLRVTGSFGIAQRLVDTPTPEALIDRADQALADTPDPAARSVLSRNGDGGQELCGAGCPADVATPSATKVA